MSIVEIRKQNHLTQKEAAILVGIPYRTYIRYEENESYKGNFKYRKILEELLNKTKVDETHGILSQERIIALLKPILDKYHITCCYLFGSYARGEARENSDIDLLVDTELTGIDFFRLVEEMRVALYKRIDLLRLMDLTSDNPIILEILKDGLRIK